MANSVPVEAEGGAAGLTLEPNHDNGEVLGDSEQGPPSVVPAQIPETSDMFSRLSPGEVSLMLYLLCHGIGTEAIGRALARHRMGGSGERKATPQAHVAVMVEVIEYTDGPARTMTALRQTAMEVAQEVANTGYRWYLEHATAWDADTKGVRATNGDAVAAVAKRHALARFKRDNGRDPRNTKREGHHFETLQAELQAEEDAATKFGYTQGDQQGLEAFLLRKLVDMVPIILLDDIDMNV